MVKSRIVNVKRNIITPEGKKKNVEVCEKQIVIFSKSLQKKLIHDIETDYLRSKNVINKSFSMKPIRKTNAISDSYLDEREDFFGYRVFLTSELDMDEMDDIRRQNELVKVDRAFKFRNYDTDTEYINLTREEKLNGHFLICFLSFLILKMFEEKLDGALSVMEAVDELRRTEVACIEDNKYMFLYGSEKLKKISEIMEMDFMDKKFVDKDFLDKMVEDIKKS